MTRLEQWLIRRNRMLNRLAREWNARHRGHSHWITDGVEYFGLQHGGGQWHRKGLLIRPQVLTKKLRVQIMPHNLRLYCHRNGTVGKWSPPHYKSDLSPFDPPGTESKFRFAWNRTHIRNVQWRAHKNGRLGGEGYLGYVAWVYWRKRGKWPDWDPQNRSPVDSPTLGREDDW